MGKKGRQLVLSLVLLILPLIKSGCTSPESVGKLDGAIDSQRIRAHLQYLSDDIMEGRAPGSRGGELAAKYISSQFQEVGLLPAVGDSSYFQQVKLSGMLATPSLVIRSPGNTWRLNPGVQFVGWTQIDTPFVSIRNKQIIFVGYGINAPEYEWNDYEGIDVTGKVLLMLMSEPYSQDSKFFAGKAWTSYRRFACKYEEAARRGAEGAILIRTSNTALVPWQVFSDSGTKERFYLKSPEDEEFLSLQSIISQEVAEEILSDAGFELDDLISRANTSTFNPIELPFTVNATVRNEIRSIESPNVIAKLVGSDPLLKNECVIYTSHYDHLGKIESDAEDGIFNGAFDNASGTATLIEIAQAFKQIPFRPKRTILFAAVAAEESGLLGSKYYVSNPVYPLAKTIANINLDGVKVWGMTHDIIARGAERSTIYNVVNKVAIEMRMQISPDPAPEKGYFFRSDQFSFARMGVPAVYISAGVKFIGKPEEWIESIRNDHLKSLHTVNDEYDPSWNFDGAAQVALFALKTGLYLANTKEMPQWNAGEQFGKIREKHLSERTNH